MIRIRYPNPFAETGFKTLFAARANAPKAGYLIRRNPPQEVEFESIRKMLV